MDQHKLESMGVGFRCRRCGISVFTSQTRPKLRTACKPPKRKKVKSKKHG